ncbi:DUF2062 domain-containing protein [Sphingomonas sp. BGYR3]|uniref:DUF2062 domain-containing protein n=1 Tax=Sphingomonas sp. BGYR3 TaxID=2975483 RepID=UPI00325FBC8C
MADPVAGRRLIDRFLAAMPTREQLADHRLTRPFANRVLAPSLWRFTRRSVPRGVALGVVTGIMVPVAQIPATALLALPLRANIPAAAATTFITNPFTTPPIWVAAYVVGKWLLRLDEKLPGNPISAGAAAANRGWLDWLFVEAGPATLTGLVLFSILGAIIAYFGTALGWRWWIGRKWRRSRSTVASGVRNQRPTG